MNIEAVKNTKKAIGEVMALLAPFYKKDLLAIQPFIAYATAADEGRLIAVRVKKKMTGVVLFTHRKKKGDIYIVNIARTDEAEPGTADALFDAVESAARDLGAGAITLDVRSSNDRARKFYEARGMEFKGEAEGDATYQLDMTPEPIKQADGEPNWITGDSNRINDLIPEDKKYDLIFSCPPYADLEVYSDDPADISNMDYDQFLAVYREIIAKACARLRDNRFAVWVVGEVRGGKHGAYRNFVSDTIQAFEDAGLRYYNEAILVTATGSLALRAGHIFRAARKIGKGHQNVLVFTKGDAAGIDPIKGLSNYLTEYFEQHRRLLESHEKVLVFAKGDPHEATDDLGEPTVSSPEFFEEMMNESE